MIRGDPVPKESEKRMRICRMRTAVGALLALVLAGAGCSSSYSTRGTSTPTDRGSSAKPVYTIGVLTDLTGLLAADGKPVPVAVKAAEDMYNAQGYDLRYVVADDATSPTGALTAAQELVRQDHVFAVIMVSAVGFAAAAYLTAQGIPVIGSSSDGPEWITSRNMFSVTGTPRYSDVQTDTGDILELLGAHDYAVIGYGISPSSADAARSEATSAQLAGIHVGYLNANFPFGDTNVGPEVLAMKAAGVDSLGALVEQPTAFAILEGLKQQGVTLKVPLLSIGYGGDLLSAGPAALQTAKGAYFGVPMEPLEMGTSATRRFAQAMRTVGIAQDQIEVNEYMGYASVAAFVSGLRAAGNDPTRAQFISAMLGIRKFNAAGLYGSHSVGFAMDQRGQGAYGADDCSWLVRWSGSSFQLVPGADPICGRNVPTQSAKAPG